MEDSIFIMPEAESTEKNGTLREDIETKNRNTEIEMLKEIDSKLDTLIESTTTEESMEEQK